jgi:predicted aconitase
MVVLLNMEGYRIFSGVSCVTVGTPHRTKEAARNMAKDLKKNNPDRNVHVYKETNGSASGQYQVYVSVKK